MTTIRRPLGLRFWLITLATVAGMLTTASLGRWQLSRAAQKEALQAMLDARGRMPAMDGRVLLSQPAMATTEAETLVHRAVVLEGRWVPEHTVYLDNRQMNGRPGFFVLTPLQLVGTPSGAVLVQRGWVPRNFLDRTQLPPVATPVGTVELQGRVALPPSKLFELGAGDKATAAAGGDPAQRSSHIRQNLDLTEFRAETQLPILRDVSVLQTGDASEGLLRDWPEVATGVEKHYGYAFQWFGLAGLITLLYVWFQIVRRIHPARRSPSSARE